MTMQARVDAAIDAALGDRIVGLRGSGAESGCAGLCAGGGAGGPGGGAGDGVGCGVPARLGHQADCGGLCARMVDLGLIGLDEPVTNFLRKFRPRFAGAEAVIRIRDLLNHTSGLGYEGPGDFPRGLSGSLIPLEEVMARLGEQPLLFAPGTGWEYGMSIDVLGAVVAADQRRRRGGGFGALCDWAARDGGHACLASAMWRGWRSLITMGRRRCGWRVR